MTRASEAAEGSSVWGGGGVGKVSQIDTHKLDIKCHIALVAFHFGGVVAPLAPPIPPPLRFAGRTIDARSILDCQA